MKLIVGLGNPGLLYSCSRHNIGFETVKSLARSLKSTFKRERLVFSLVGKARLGETQIILALPQRFMNLSGLAVKALVKEYKISLPDLLVICDDLDLELGRIKLRPSGSSGGHRGLQSIIEHLGSVEFSRLRIGIGRPRDPAHAAEYVLKGFLRKEKPIIAEAKENSVQCCLSWLEKGVTQTMNTFNTNLPVCGR